MAWLYLPPIAIARATAGEACSESHSALVPAASILDCISPPQDIELWVTSSGKATLRPLSWRGWKTRPWIKRLSGTTLPASTANLGAASWISCMADIRANLSALPEKNSVITIHDTSGRTSPASSPNASQDFASSKMWADIYAWDLNKSMMTFDQWVTALRRACLQRKKLARPINEKDYSSWPTARVSSANGACRKEIAAGNPKGRLEVSAQIWLTPRAQETTEKQQTFLKRMNDRSDRCFGSLTAQTMLWSTPTARDWKDGTLKDTTVPTNSLLSRQAPRTDLGGSAISNDGRTLNPLFVEALMGWPIGWTDCVSAATELSRWSRLMRSKFLQLLQTSNCEQPCLI
jgi:hypothetical protein